MKTLKLLSVLLVCALFLPACLQSNMSTFTQDLGYQFVEKNENGVALYTRFSEIQKVKKDEKTVITRVWEDDWFENHPQEGLNQGIPHQVTNVRSQTVSDTIEFSHTWSLVLLRDMASLGYEDTSSHIITIEKEVSHQKTYGPVMVFPGYKCRLVADLVIKIETGCFAGDLYKKQAQLLGYRWILIRKDVEFGYWKSTTNQLCYQFESEALTQIN